MIPEIPEFLREELIREYGQDTAGQIIHGYTVRRPVTLRVNRLKSDPQEIEAAFLQAGISWTKVSWYEDAYILANVQEEDIQALPVYEQGKIYLQNLSSMLPPVVMDPKPGLSILDMAAAPGGKTTQIAAMCGNQAAITACERDRIRAERLSFNLNRQGATRVQVMQIDSRNLDPFFRFDAILLDAPCTGSGTILLTEGEKQRRMDTTWVKKTVQLQEKLLQKAIQLLSKGKEMVYSTCSVMKLENEQVIRKFISQGLVELVPIDEALQASLPLLPTDMPGTMTVCPTELYEGFFAAKLRKK